MFTFEELECGHHLRKQTARNWSPDATRRRCKQCLNFSVPKAEAARLER